MRHKCVITDAGAINKALIHRGRVVEKNAPTHIPNVIQYETREAECDANVTRSVKARSAF